jgi:hypothetical protein
MKTLELITNGEKAAAPSLRNRVACSALHGSSYARGPKAGRRRVTKKQRRGEGEKGRKGEGEKES